MGAQTALTIEHDGSIQTAGNVKPGTVIRFPIYANNAAVEGDVWNGQANATLRMYINNVPQSVSGVLFTQTQAITVVNSVSELTMFGTGFGTLTTPANFLKVGKTLRFRLRGHFGTGASNTNFRLRLKFGSVTLIDSGTVTMPVSHIRVGARC